MRPFRWNIARREQLGSLLFGGPVSAYPQFVDDLGICAARLLARCGDADRLVFVGRSPESLFDYLSGLLAGTTWEDRLMLLNVSYRVLKTRPGLNLSDADLAALHAHFSASGIAPSQIEHDRNALTFIDLVSSGGTMEFLHEVMHRWAGEAGIAPSAIRNRLRYLGITERTRNSPNTWRWWQHADWLNGYSSRAVINVSVPSRMWQYMGNYQPKVGHWNPPWRWSDPAQQRPPRRGSQMAALQLAVHLYDAGCSRTHRERLVKRMVRTGGMKERWFRALVGELRG